LWETEVLKCHEFFQARLQVKVKCAVLFSITGLFKFDRKWRKRYKCRLCARSYAIN